MRRVIPIKDIIRECAQCARYLNYGEAAKINDSAHLALSCIKNILKSLDQHRLITAVSKKEVFSPEYTNDVMEVEYGEVVFDFLLLSLFSYQRAELFGNTFNYTKIADTLRDELMLASKDEYLQQKRKVSLREAGARALKEIVQVKGPAASSSRSGDGDDDLSDLIPPFAKSKETASLLGGSKGGWFCGLFSCCCSRRQTVVLIDPDKVFGIN
jgi:hypothetical protein